MVMTAASAVLTAHSSGKRSQNLIQAATGRAEPFFSMVSAREGRAATVCAWEGRAADEQGEAHQGRLGPARGDLGRLADTAGIEAPEQSLPHAPPAWLNPA
jgi:hypothetical protein